jgi:hypothetical protein
MRAGSSCNLLLGSSSSSSSFHTTSLKAAPRLRDVKAATPTKEQLIEQKKADDSKSRLLKMGDSFAFSCTACGKCCHKLAGSVMLGPHDIYLMSRAPSLNFLAQEAANHGVQLGTTLALHKFFGRAFFFSMRDFTQVLNEQGWALSCTLTPRDGLDPALSVCHFALPLVEKRSARFVKDAEAVGFGDFTQTDGDRNFERMKGRLLCGLGPEHMPMACTSYPLRREPSKRFRLAPPKSCEGVDAVGAETHTVASYYKARGLTARNEEWLWYEDLGLVIGHSPLFMGLEHWREKGELTHATLSVYDDAVQLLRLIWFDFDGLACAPPGGFASWEDAKKAIAKATSIVGASFGNLNLKNPATLSKSVPVFRRLLCKEGVLPESSRLFSTPMSKERKNAAVKDA